MQPLLDASTTRKEKECRREEVDYLNIMGLLGSLLFLIYGRNQKGEGIGCVTRFPF